MTDLRELTKERIIKGMFERVQTTTGWKLLVLDEVSTRVLSSVLKMTDLTQHNVSIVEKLELKRKPMKEMDAVYFITPTEESVKQVVDDFLPQKRLYARGHVFLTSTLSDSLFDIMQNSQAIKYITTVTELNIEFLIAESQLFLTSFQPKDYIGTSPFYKMFSPRATDALREPEFELIARQVTTMCATLGEYPLVRYDGEGVSSKQLAVAIQNSLDDLQRTYPEAFPQTDGPRMSLLVVDRSVDIVAPFLHEFTYQAMAYDLLKIENNYYEYKTRNAADQEIVKKTLLDEDDHMWLKLRHLHIAEAIQTVTREFQEFSASNKAAKLQSNRDQGAPTVKSLKAASELVRDMPQYTTLLNKFSLHLNMTQEAMKRFNDGLLAEVADVEQDMATKQTVDGDPVTEPESRIKALLRNPKISGSDKARLVMQFVAFHGPLSKEDNQELALDQVGFSPADMQAFANLSLLTANKDVLINIDKSKKKKSKQGEEEDVPYHLSRYVPQLKKIAEDLSNNTLDAAKYPYIKPPPEDADTGASSKKGQSARTTKANWADKVSLASSSSGSAPKQQSTRAEGRFLLYVAGGITYSELRYLYQLNKDMLVGSTNIWKPTEFVDELRGLKKEADAKQRA